METEDPFENLALVPDGTTEEMQRWEDARWAELEMQAEYEQWLSEAAELGECYPEE